eukprot:Amastigsp_a855393_11.p3 type:complete len:144 gc:universal Amastigsp_a855393_11:698-267(-)
MALPAAVGAFFSLAARATISTAATRTRTSRGRTANSPGANPVVRQASNWRWRATAPGNEEGLRVRQSKCSCSASSTAISGACAQTLRRLAASRRRSNLVTRKWTTSRWPAKHASASGVKPLEFARCRSSGTHCSPARNRTRST